MRREAFLALLLAASPSGCAAIAGVNDFEPVDCVDCDATTGDANADTVTDADPNADTAADADAAAPDADANADAHADADADAKPDADAGPTCTSNLGCPCGQVCIGGACVASDCTKDSHWCPTGLTCTCVGGKWQISAASVAADAGVITAQPASSADNGADLIMRDYDLRDLGDWVYSFKVHPANCTSSWYYKNIVFSCADIGAGTSSFGGMQLSRRGDPDTCRPPSPPQLTIEHIRIVDSGAYNTFTDLEYAKVTVRDVQSAGGFLFDTWGPGKIGELDVIDSPSLFAELQGSIDQVIVTNSPNFRWWTTSPTETNRATWPLIKIQYDAVSCPTGRSLVSTSSIQETCKP